VPYIDGTFDSKYYPYYYQEFKVRCSGRELFSIEPDMVNLPLGAKDRSIISVLMTNLKNDSQQVDVLVVSRTLPELSNWITFDLRTGYCEDYSDQISACRNTNLTITAALDSNNPGENTTTLKVIEASRVGSYVVSIILKDHETGEEIGRKDVVINVMTNAVGGENLSGLILLMGFIIYIHIPVMLRKNSLQK
jgi:hypothetical protein